MPGANCCALFMVVARVKERARPKGALPESVHTVRASKDPN
jgi:hypothetical protein